MKIAKMIRAPATPMTVPTMVPMLAGEESPAGVGVAVGVGIDELVVEGIGGGEREEIPDADGLKVEELDECLSAEEVVVAFAPEVVFEEASSVVVLDSAVDEPRSVEEDSSESEVVELSSLVEEAAEEVLNVECDELLELLLLFTVPVIVPLSMVETTVMMVFVF